MSVRSAMAETAKIVLLCVAFSILYGTVHDQITIRISLEYFTVDHPALITTASPTVLALFWGFTATWWVGVLLGLPLSLACLAGRWPQRNAASMIKPLLILFAFCGGAAAVSGIIGGHLAREGTIQLMPPVAEKVPSAGQADYLTALWIHSGSYAAAALGGIILIVSALVSRLRIADGRGGE